MTIKSTASSIALYSLAAAIVAGSIIYEVTSWNTEKEREGAILNNYVAALVNSPSTSVNIGKIRSVEGIASRLFDVPSNDKEVGRGFMNEYVKQWCRLNPGKDPSTIRLGEDYKFPVSPKITDNYTIVSRVNQNYVNNLKKGKDLILNLDEAIEQYKVKTK